MVVADLILGRPSPWAELYSPARAPPLKAAAELAVEEGGTVAASFAERLLPKLTLSHELAPGTGAVVQTATENKVALYCDEEVRYVVNCSLFLWICTMHECAHGVRFTFFRSANPFHAGQKARDERGLPPPRLPRALGRYGEAVGVPLPRQRVHRPRKMRPGAGDERPLAARQRRLVEGRRARGRAVAGGGSVASTICIVDQGASSCVTAAA